MKEIEATISYFEKYKKFDTAIYIAKEAGMTGRMLEAYSKGKAFYDGQLAEYEERRRAIRMEQIMEGYDSLANINYGGPSLKIAQGLRSLVEATGMSKESLEKLV